MDLEITHSNNLFKVKGSLQRHNIHVFKRYFRNIFEKLNTITISIEDLKSIDRHGVNAIAQLHNESIVKQKQLSIIGLGCQEVYTHFKSKETETAA